MHQILFKLGPITIYSYALMYGIGLIVAFYLIEYWVKREGIDPRIVLNLFFILFLTVVFGARIFYVAFYDVEVESFFDIISPLKGGQMLYGGLIISIPIGLWYLKRQKVDMGKILDCFAPAIPLGLVFGRVGCFLYGCCFGSHTDHEWAVQFPRLMSAKHGIIGSPAFTHHMNSGLVESADTHSLFVHPTQLYSAAILFIIFVFLFVLKRKRVLHGQLFWVFLGLYAIFRFVIEFIRGDNKEMLYGLHISQLLGIPVLIIAILFYYKRTQEASK